MVSRGAAVLVLLAGSACGSDAPAATDGALPDGTTDASASWPAAGAPPVAIPVFDPCNEGWHRVSDGTVVEGSELGWCEPFPEAGSEDCPEGRAHFPGEPGCSPIGSACPTGEYADGLPADGTTVYVRPGATGGDGTEGNPYGSLGEFSISGLPVGTTIALSRGRHDGPVQLLRGLILRGACAADTELVAAAPATGVRSGVVMVTMDGATAEVRDLTLADSARAGVSIAADGADVRVEGVYATGTDTAFQVLLGALTARTVVARETRPLGSPFGRGLHAQMDATADVGRALFERCHDTGVFASESSALTLTDTVIRDTTANSSTGRAGRGLVLQFGGTAEATGLLVERNRDDGAFVSDPDSSLSLADSIVRDTLGLASDGTFGRGINAQLGATLEVGRTVIERNRDVSVNLTNDVTAVLSDVLVRDTQTRDSDGMFGRALNVQESSTATVDRVVFERSRDAAIHVNRPGSTVSLADVVVRETDADDVDRAGGRALGIQLGATAEVTRALFEDNVAVAVVTLGEPSAVTITDVLVRDSLPRACAETTCASAPAGYGAGAYVGAALTITRFAIERSNLCGVHVAESGQMDLSIGEIRDNPIGVCMQVEGYDTARLMQEVRFRDNEVNLQATSLPVPEALESLPAAM